MAERLHCELHRSLPPSEPPPLTSPHLSSPPLHISSLPSTFRPSPPPFAPPHIPPTPLPRLFALCAEEHADGMSHTLTMSQNLFPHSPNMSNMSRAGPTRTLIATGPMPSGFEAFLDKYIMTRLLHNGQPVWLGSKNGAFARACCGQFAGIWAFLNRSYYASFKPSALAGSECSDGCGSHLNFDASGKWVLTDGETWRPANVSMDGPLTL